MISTFHCIYLLLCASPYDGWPLRRGDGYGKERTPAEAKADTASAAALEDTGERIVTGICVVRQQQGRNPGPALYIIAALGTGKVVRVDLTAGSGLTPRPGSAGGAPRPALAGRDLFHFHTGSTWGLSAEDSSACRLFATTCDDRKLMVWDAQDCLLLAKAALSVSTFTCSWSSAVIYNIFSPPC